MVFVLKRNIEFIYSITIGVGVKNIKKTSYFSKLQFKQYTCSFDVRSFSVSRVVNFLYYMRFAEYYALRLQK